MIRPKVAVC